MKDPFNELVYVDKLYFFKFERIGDRNPLKVTYIDKMYFR